MLTNVHNFINWPDIQKVYLHKHGAIISATLNNGLIFYIIFMLEYKLIFKLHFAGKSMMFIIPPHSRCNFTVPMVRFQHPLTLWILVEERGTVHAERPKNTIKNRQIRPKNAQRNRKSVFSSNLQIHNTYILRTIK